MREIKPLVEKLRKILTQAKGRIIILVAQVDPDAIGAAIGLTQIIEYLKPDDSDLVTKIVYCGKFSHPQNKTIANCYNLGMVMSPITDITLEPEDQLALVDSQTLKDGRLPETYRNHQPIIVIDHHRGENIDEGDNEIIWIEEVGSTCTMIVELGQAADIKFYDHAPTLLTMGIHNDTKDLVDSGPRDLEAHRVVSRDTNPRDLGRLINYNLPDSYFKTLSYALDHMSYSHGRLAVNAGYLAIDSGDDLATIADYLIRREGVSMVFVWGIVGQQVRVCARSNNLSVPLDQFLKEHLVQEAGAKLTPAGQGQGGAMIPLNLGFWSGMNELEREAQENLVSLIMIRRLLDQ